MFCNRGSQEKGEIMKKEPNLIFSHWDLKHHMWIPDELIKMVRENHRRKMKLDKEIN